MDMGVRKWLHVEVRIILFLLTILIESYEMFTFPNVERPSPIPTSIFLVAAREVEDVGLLEYFWFSSPELDGDCLLDNVAGDWRNPCDTFTVFASSIEKLKNLQNLVPFAARR